MCPAAGQDGGGN